MAITSTRLIQIVFTGDVTGTESINAASNAASQGGVQVITLSSGANTITIPLGGTVPTAVTIVPPTGNQNSITLKGVTGDTGIALHLTDPTSLALASSVTTFVLTAGATITGVRLYYS